MYIWLYTNGDLVTKEKLKSLKKAGLDEIRFDIAARNYDLRPLELATHIIKTVTIETPAIPEDYEIMKKCLLEAEKLGVSYVNLHQLLGTVVSYKNFIKRGYTFLHNYFGGTLESHMCQLQLMKYTLDKKINLPINCCTLPYRIRFTVSRNLRWQSPLVKTELEELTESNHIRGLSIQDSPKNIQALSKTLKNKQLQNNSWLMNDSGTELFIHSRMLKYIDFDKYRLTIRYFKPKLHGTDGESFKKITWGTKNKFFVEKICLYKIELNNKEKVDIFKKVFIRKIDEQRTIRGLQKKYHINLNDIKTFLGAFREYETVEAGFAEIY